ncbi:MAG: hypothetical protein IJJ26_08490, partial [Victivallales bacterium]|nr:hypothetical protein [Victivallales bacterium]
SDITEIGQYAFYNCESLDKIIIPKNVIWLYKRWATIPDDISPELEKRYPFYARKRPYHSQEDPHA